MNSQQEPSSNSLTADNLEKFGKLNHPPGVPEDGALLSEAKLQSIISFLDEMEKSEQERPRSAASATQREVSPSVVWESIPDGNHPLVLVPGGSTTFSSCFFCCGRASFWKKSWLMWSKCQLLPRR